MTFLHPEVWWFAFAALIPIIIHLIHFHKPKKILFSNVILLKRIAEQVQRKRRLKDYLLLLNRILLILTLVALFAEPVQLRSQAASLQRFVLILIDNSLSMTAGDAYGALLQQAKNIAERIISAYPITTRFLVLPFSRPQGYRRFYSKEQALKRLQSIEPSPRSPTLQSLLEKLPMFYGKVPPQSIKETYFISDFQTATLKPDSLQPTLLPSLDTYKIRWIKIGSKTLANQYIQSATLMEPFLQVHFPIRLKVTVHNTGVQTIPSLPVTLVLNNKVEASKTLQLESAQLKEQVLHFSVTQPGWYIGYLSVKDPQVTFDNRYYIAFEVKEKPKIIFCYREKVARHWKVLFEKVFKDHFEVDFVEVRQLSRLRLSDFSGIILDAIPHWSDALIRQLKEWLKEGNGLICFPEESEHFDAFLAHLGLGSRDSLMQSTQGYTLAMPDLQHPFFKGIFEKPRRAQVAIESPTVYRYLSIVPSLQHPYEVLLKFRSNAPFLLHFRWDKGHVFLYTSRAERWSDLAQQSLFVPLIHRALVWSTQSAPEWIALTPPFSTPLNIAAKSGTVLHLTRVLPKDSLHFIPPQQQRGAYKQMHLPANIAQGVYWLHDQQGHTYRYIAINPSHEESLLQFATTTDLKETIDKKQLPITLLSSEEQVLQHHIKTHSAGTPLWRYFLILALCLLTTEVIIIKWL